MEDYLMFGKVSINRIFLEHDEEQLWYIELTDEPPGNMRLETLKPEVDIGVRTHDSGVRNVIRIERALSLGMMRRRCKQGLYD
jgi:hypothetical protein